MSEEIHEAKDPRHAAFLCYSTRPDYGLSRKIHRFLSGFHEEAAMKTLGISARKFCMDGVTFRHPRQPGKVEGATQGENQPSESIRELIRPYLLASDSLVILWPGSDLATVSIIWEFQEFLRQNQEHNLQRPVWLAVTRGENPAAPGFFSEALVSSGISSNIYFDFRGHDQKSAAWNKVRDFNEEQLRLACELFDIRDAEQRPLSADDLLPAWKMERLGRLRRTRAYAIAVAIAMTGATAVAIYQANAAEKEKKNAETARTIAQQEEANAKAARDAEREQRKIADQNRARAEKEQRNAEALVQRMQGEIRQTLLSLGRMDLMFAVNDAVGAYLEESTSESQGRLSMKAIRQQQQAETFLEMGELSSARQEFEKALDLARKAKWDSSSAWENRRYIGLHLMIGQLLKGDPAQAEKLQQHLAEAQVLAEKQLAFKDPPIDAYVLWAGATAELAALLPTSMQREAKFDEIISRLLKAVGELPEIEVTAKGELVIAAATTRHRLVTDLRQEGLTNRALSAAEENVGMLKAAAINKSKWRMEYARALSVAGDLHATQNIWDKASERYEQSAALTGKLAQDEPRNLPALELHLHCLSNLQGLANQLKSGQTRIDELAARKAVTERQIKLLWPSKGVSVEP